MIKEILQQFANLGIILLISGLIWWYYRNKTYPVSEQYQTFAPRFWSGFVDSCVLWPIGFVSAVLLCLHLPRVLAALIVIVDSLSWVVYTVVMHARFGQTAGKMVTKVRVVDNRTEGSISWFQAWLRDGIPALLSLGFLGYQVYIILTQESNVVSAEKLAGIVTSGTFWLLTGLPTLWFLAEVLTMLTNSKRRALHDFIAGTVVVRTNLVRPPVASSPDPNETLSTVDNSASTQVPPLVG